jgi:serine/threonine protein kinase
MIGPGTVIAARYSLVREIGRGGMSVVYEARHLTIGKRVAIKFLSPAFQEHVESIRRFQREAQIAGTIGHPNICEVHDFGITGDVEPYIVMSYLEGETLSSLLRREKVLSPPRALAIMLQVLDALVEVHRRGIIHRDLKPGNVFLEQTPRGETVKLLDFGISKIGSLSPGSALTQAGSSLGTPSYMSPEQITDSKTVDHRADVYSCGVMLYRMLAGRVPYEGTGMSEILVHIVNDPPPDLGREIPGVSPGLRELVGRAIEKDPGRRIASAEELKARIEALTSPPTKAAAATAEAPKPVPAVPAASQKMYEGEWKWIAIGCLGAATVLAITALYLFYRAACPWTALSASPGLQEEEASEAHLASSAQPTSYGASCANSTDCVLPLECVAGACRYRSDENGLCISAIDCGPGLLCDRGTCVR